jgi:hypothetical protein
LKLPHREKAYVAVAKIRDYLLLETHPAGWSKAKLLRALGHDERTMDVLIANLIDIANSGDVDKVIPTGHGVKYSIDGLVQTPSGVAVQFRTIWIIDKGHDRPRFVTGYPTGLKETV